MHCVVQRCHKVCSLLWRGDGSCQGIVELSFFLLHSSSCSFIPFLFFLFIILFIFNIIWLIFLFCWGRNDTVYQCITIVNLMQRRDVQCNLVRFVGLNIAWTHFCCTPWVQSYKKAAGTQAVLGEHLDFWRTFLTNTYNIYAFKIVLQIAHFLL